MTREQWEQHLQKLGSFAELMPPWQVLQQEQERRERERADRIARALLESWYKK